MKSERLLDIVHKYARTLPSVKLEQPFGPNWDVYKVCGKVFVFLSLSPERTLANVKVTPENGQVLRDAYADITPAYHMNKHHWVSLNPGPTLSDALIQELVFDSYRLVVAKLPRKQRPIDPESFGHTSSSSVDMPSKTHEDMI